MRASISRERSWLSVVGQSVGSMQGGGSHYELLPVNVGLRQANGKGTNTDRPKADSL